MTYALQDEINVLQILPKKYQMTKVTLLHEKYIQDTMDLQNYLEIFGLAIEGN